MISLAQPRPISRRQRANERYRSTTALKVINPIRMGGVEVLPLVEGGKGVAVSNGATSGGWASGGGVGTFSGVNADSYDAEGRIIRQVYHCLLYTSPSPRD